MERRTDEMAAQLCLVGNSVEWAVGEWRAAETREEAWSEEAEEAREEAEERDVWAEEAEERAEELERIRRTNHMLRARVREAGAAEAAAVERAAETERRAEAVERGAEAEAMRRFQVVMANWRQM